MKVKEITQYLETLAPLYYQEDYDNAGLIIGNPDREIESVLISLDCTEAVVDEAIQKGCGLIVSHHPIVFKGLKQITGKNYIERVVIKAIKNDIALYAIHTNFDNVITGVNKKICNKLGIKNPQILHSKSGMLKKLVTFCPVNQADDVRKAMFETGAGKISNYSECSYNSEGIGTFKAGEDTNPFVGSKGEQHHEPEVRIELIYSVDIEKRLIDALNKAHPYEEVAYDLYPLSNSHPQIGSGMIGDLDVETDENEFLSLVKTQLGAKVIRHTRLLNKKIKRVAVCGGAGSFLLDKALSNDADIFITADYKYHEFFDADEKIVIADVGHFESEQFTQELLLENIRKNFPKFAVHLTQQNTNPIYYFI